MAQCVLLRCFLYGSMILNHAYSKEELSTHWLQVRHSLFAKHSASKQSILGIILKNHKAGTMLILLRF